MWKPAPSGSESGEMKAVMRSTRQSVMAMRAQLMKPPPAMSRARWLSGAPATKKRVQVVATMTTVVPMSGSTTTRLATSPTISVKGTKPIEKCLMLSRRLASQAAM